MSGSPEIKVRVQLLEENDVKESCEWVVNDKEKAINICTAVRGVIKRKLGQPWPTSPMSGMGPMEGMEPFQFAPIDLSEKMVKALKERKINSSEKALPAQDVARAILEDSVKTEKDSGSFPEGFVPYVSVGRISQGLSRVALKLEAQGKLKSVGESGQKRYYVPKI